MITTTFLIRRRQPATRRQGTMSVLALFLLIVLIVFTAFGVEIGSFLMAKSELQRTADAAAVSAVAEYIEQLSGNADANAAVLAARSTGVQYAAFNAVGNHAPMIDQNVANSVEGDIYFGQIQEFNGQQTVMHAGNSSNFNAIRVRVSRTAAKNGEVPFLFGRVSGTNSKPLIAEATAAFVRDIRGFKKPPKSNLNALPFAIKIPLWIDLMAASGTDEWTWNASTNSVVPGPDGIPEINMYPQETGSSGNSGTIDIGPANNSTNDLKRQIESGITQADLDHIGGALSLNNDGILELNGDTGISAGIASSLQQIVGKPNILSVYSKVTGNGNNANYTIIRFVGVRIMEVDLTGSKKKSKRIIIQRAPIMTTSVIPSPTSGTSDYIYSNVFLVK